MSDQVRASHLLIKHSGSRRPASRLSDNITRSKQEAIDELLELRSQIVSGTATFQELAIQNSDCSSGTRGGDLGPFSRGMMQKPFEDAAFGLRVDELSGVVDTDSGVHIILRTA
ncbi:Peptidyl-prolyl cis-trans isomerase NIMA-interacting protein 1 [Globisporangium polare]